MHMDDLLENTSLIGIDLGYISPIESFGYGC